MLRIEWEMEQGRSTRWLARELGVSDSHTARLLAGERPWTPELREKAAQALRWWKGHELGTEADLFAEVRVCSTCEGYGTRKLEEDGHRFVVFCKDCDGDGVVSAEEVTD